MGQIIFAALEIKKILKSFSFFTRRANNPSPPRSNQQHCRLTSTVNDQSAGKHSWMGSVSSALLSVCQTCVEAWCWCSPSWACCSPRLSPCSACSSPVRWCQPWFGKSQRDEAVSIFSTVPNRRTLSVKDVLHICCVVNSVLMCHLK